MEMKHIMKDLLRPIYQERASEQNTLGILMIEKRFKEGPMTDTFDNIIFVIVEKGDQPYFIKHYQFGNQKAALYIVEKNLVDEWILKGNHRNVIDWILNGKIIFDRNELIATIQQQLKDYPLEHRKYKMGLEFAKLVRRFINGKAFFENHHYLDAYNHIVHALHHLARLAIIQQGFHPEVTVWNQVKQIDPEIYKLYEELIQSEESLEKRLKLLFLASEFLINKHLEKGTEHLLQVLKTRKEAWAIGEILNHRDLQLYSVDLPIIIEFLIEKGYLDVVEKETKGKDIFHRYYRVVEKN